MKGHVAPGVLKTHLRVLHVVTNRHHFTLLVIFLILKIWCNMQKGDLVFLVLFFKRKRCTGKKKKGWRKESREERRDAALGAEQLTVRSSRFLSDFQRGRRLKLSLCSKKRKKKKRESDEPTRCRPVRL